MRVSTLGETLRAVADKLADAGVEDARRDAQVLVCHVLGRDRAYLHAFPEILLDADQRDRIEILARQRAARVPMSQVLGSREFWSLNFRVTGDTLTPRPDSETLIEAALARIEDKPGPLRLADLGTGTGCLLISLLDARPQDTGLGIDCSEAALAVARDNAATCGVSDRATFVRGNWLDAVAGRFDLILSNPPYIPRGDLADLEPEVVAHEPHLALNGGVDGLDAYRAILPVLADHLTESGVAVLEHGAGQGPQLDAMAAACGLAVAARHDDLAGLRRCIVLRVC